MILIKHIDLEILKYVYSVIRALSWAPLKHEMAGWHLTMWDTVIPYNFCELTTFKSVVFRLTEARSYLSRSESKS